jgi:hypothetical protein
MGEDDFPWADAVRAELVKLTPAEIVRFDLWLDQKVYALYTWDHWGAMRLVSGYESDAAFWRVLTLLAAVCRMVREEPGGSTDAEALPGWVWQGCNETHPSRECNRGRQSFPAETRTGRHCPRHSRSRKRA